MTSEQYWKLKAFISHVNECHMKRQLIEQEFLQAAKLQNEYMKELGLDPHQQYRWNDETCELTPMQPRPSLVPHEQQIKLRGRK